jgi:hypothetical protein
MNFAKFLLFSILVIAGLGGVLAYKAARIPSVFFVTGPNGQCTVQVVLFYRTTTPGAAGATTLKLSTVSTTNPCPTTWVVPSE